MTGYLHPMYAESLAEFGQPTELPQCGGWILQRPIPGSAHRDAMGCYPLFCCLDWSKLRADLNNYAGDLVSVTLVLNPFTSLTVDDLEKSFDVVKPFKNHFVVDLKIPIDQQVNRHHRYYARKSLRTVKVEMVGNPHHYLEEWGGLYDNLVRRHQLGGIKAFSMACFRRQFEIPGLIMFRATCGDRVMGAQLWYLQGNVAHSHLTAISDSGYASRAAYGIYWTAIETFKDHFSNEVRYLDLGAGASLSQNEKDGLTEFKRGWSNCTRTKYIAAHIFDRQAYAELSRNKCIIDKNYFPAYRQGEFQK